MDETEQVEREAQGEDVAAVGQDEDREPEAAATTAIVPAGKGVRLSNLLGTSQTLEELSEDMVSAVCSETGDDAQMLKRIELIQQQIEQLVIQSAMRNIAESAMISDGHFSGDGVLWNREIASAFLESIDIPSFPDISWAMSSYLVPSESYLRFLGMQEDSFFTHPVTLGGINRPMKNVLEFVHEFGMDRGAAPSRMYELIEAEERQSQKFLQSLHDEFESQQWQRAETMEATFARLERGWQQNDEAIRRRASTLERWRESQSPLASQRWGVHEPKSRKETFMERLKVMIQEGKISPAELIMVALQHDKAAPGQKLPPWSEIEAICVDYERNGHRYKNQAAFARQHNISKSTFTRYRQMWKATRGGSQM
jgi:hypothetical protein